MIELTADTIIQRTTDWYQIRLGKVTASRMGDLMGRTQKGYAATRAAYMDELLSERLTGQKADRFSSAAMQWGTEMEPKAREAYEAITGNDVVETGFVPHPGIPMFGASPDGLIGKDGLIEIKCPNTATHVKTVVSGKINQKYLLQMQTQLLCTDRAWCDFVSFDPRLPEAEQIWIERVFRDEDVIAQIEAETKKFLTELNEIVTAFRQLVTSNSARATAA